MHNTHDYEHEAGMTHAEEERGHGREARHVDHGQEVRQVALARAHEEQPETRKVYH